ncbi:hypothetical protein [Bradyrhizobium cenepequi]|uniref:hypothetical protein n=1 Tax=Bradyrhizobium cenepequi TaxID=2821403 RepID=UPI001CE2AAB9|nr:hypothetical protein [Bradyrhizobium cenepequi]MCA6112981.1 hypothetical protein [Bradyrhizobium cenepequi]
MDNWQHTSVNSITRQTKPAREPLFAILPNPAQSCLNALKCQRLNVPKEMLSDLRTLLHQPTQILDTDPVRGSGKEHHRLMRRKMSSPQKRSTNHTPISYDCRFEHASRRNNP